MLEELILKKPLKQSLAAYIEKKICIRYIFMAEIWHSQLRGSVAGGRSLSSLAARPEHLEVSLPHIHYFIYCPNLIFHDFPDSEGWQLLSTVQKVCSTCINNYTSCWSFFLKGALSKKSNLNKSRSYRCEWSWNPWVPLFLLLLLFLPTGRSHLMRSKCY